MSNLKKLLIVASLSGAGAVLSVVESMLPIIPAIPGGKLGIANIVTLVVLYTMGGTCAFAVSVVRTVVACLLYGGMNAFMYSFAGAVSSVLVMICIKALAGSRISIIGVSVSGAATHNIAQTLVAWLFVRSNSLWLYLSGLLLLSLVSGIACGYCAKESIKRLKINC